MLRICPRLCRELFHALPLALMFLLALTPGISFTEDLGRHLLLGKIILTTGHVPDTNLLTYTCPDFPFINHHWLSEVVFYLIHSAIGLNGLILFKALLLCAALALALRSAQIRRISPLLGFAAALAAVTLGYRAHIRPELFTYFGVAFYGWFIAREFSVLMNFKNGRDGSSSLRSSELCFGGVGPSRPKSEDRMPRRGIPTLGWVIIIAYGWFWANAHIYFIFGIGMIFLYWLACFLRNLINANPPFRRFALSLHSAWPRVETIGLAALIGVSLINPNGWRGLLYPLGIFGNYGVAITENASPLSYWQTVLNPMLMALPFLSILAVWVLWRTFLLVRRDSLSRRSCDRIRRGGLCGPTFLTAAELASALILCAALFAAWNMARSAPLLALTLLPALGLQACAGMSKLEVGRTLRVSRFSSDGSAALRPGSGQVTPRPTLLKLICPPTVWLRCAGIILVVILNLWLALAVVEGSYSRVFPSPIGPTPFGLDDESRYLALRRLRADGLPSPVFSDYNSGSLVEYNIYPERGYVDNRPEAFPEAFWKQEYEPALALGAAWEEMIARRGIQTVAVSTAGVKENFIRALLADRRWQLVQLDFFFAVFVRNTPENLDFLRRHAFSQEKVAQFSQNTARDIRALSSERVWRRQIMADRIVYEIYGLICLGRNDLAWPLAWEMHLRYPDYQLVHELMRVSAPPHAFAAVMETMARRARWPLAAKQVLDYGAALAAQGRGEAARAAYRRGKFFFPLARNLPPGH